MIKHYTSLLISILTILANLSAQSTSNTLYVKETYGQSSWAINNIRKITFPSGQLQINNYDGSMASFPFDIFHFFAFKNYSLGIPQTAIEQNTMLLFPNPVNDQFQISYQSDQGDVLQIKIIDMQGKEVLQQTINSLCGRNIFTINVRELTQGLYVCRVQSGSRFENVKFIKN